MKQRTKFTMFAAGSLAFALAAIGGAGLISDQEIAAAENPSAIGVSMVKGASVRIGDGDAETDQGNGMRFAMQMNKEKYEALIADESCGNFEFGVIITPATESYADISYDTVFGASKKYDWAVWTESEAGSGGWVYDHVEGCTQIMLYSFGEMYEAGIHDDPANVYVRGTISKIQNIAEEYNGWGYVRYEKDGETVSEFVGPETRSMTYVAQRAVEDNNEYSEFLTAQYIAPFAKGGEKETATTYTREYYFEQADGAYARDDELTETVANDVYINDTISDKDGKKRVEGYVFNSDAEGSVLSGKAYANGKLTLKRYYNILNAQDMVLNAADINVKRVKFSEPAASMNVGWADVDSKQDIDETIGNRLNANISKKAAVQVNVGEVDDAWKSTIAFNISSAALPKAVLAQLIEDGYDSLCFSVYRSYEMGTATWENGLGMRYIDFDKMEGATIQDTNIKTRYAAARPDNDGAFKTGTNTWKQVEYSLADLLTYYDVLFAENTPYFLCEAGIYSQNAGIFYISQVSLKKYDVNNLITDANLFTAKKIGWWDDKTMNSSGLVNRTVEYYNQEVAHRLDDTKSRNAMFKINVSTEVGGVDANQTAFRISSDFMSKAVLKKFAAAGYSKLSFAVYRQVETTKTWENGVYRAMIDFAQMEGSKLDDAAVKAKTTRETKASSTNTWVDVEYNLSDLITYYDVIFGENSPYYLCMAGIYHSLGGSLYISQFALTK